MLIFKSNRNFVIYNTLVLILFFGSFVLVRYYDFIFLWFYSTIPLAIFYIVINFLLLKKNLQVLSRPNSFIFFNHKIDVYNISNLLILMIPASELFIFKKVNEINNHISVIYWSLFLLFCLSSIIVIIRKNVRP